MPERLREIKATSKAIKTYYETLAGYDRQNVAHETAIRSAFQNLLADIAKTQKWILIPELSDNVSGRTIRPDGTLRDQYNMPRGYWEAKDSKDNLDLEIEKKIGRGYPTTNIIFEDTRQGVLFQNGREIFRADLTDPKQLITCLNELFKYEQPNIEQFEKAVDEFKGLVPELAKGLLAKIREAQKNNSRFISSFKDFMALCKTALNPNIREEAVEEMLVQHLLTERLMQTVFKDPDFIRRNVIAAEIEKVIDALVSRSFNRHEFLLSLDRFYVAIERAAQGMDDFTEKQHFLNTVYERFFQGYAIKVADTHGIVYTPQPIVDFMCASVAQVLEKEFGKTLGSKDVNILDPCTGTGNFIVNLIHRIPKRDLPRMYKEQLFANEVMLLPYYIASLNIEHAYNEQTDQYEPFEGICFVDTLGLAETEQVELALLEKKNAERVARQKLAPITVIIGNPPYNMGQVNENDNNKNRRYKGTDRRIKLTYAHDSKATLVNKLYDPYVKFFRWATDRLEGRDGIVCFVSNNSFIDNIAFDGMRKHLAENFWGIYLLDLKGNIRKDSMRDGIPLGEKHTIFGLSAMVGISISILIKCTKGKKNKGIFYSAVEFRAKREEKFNLLRNAKDLNGIKWRRIKPDDKYNWIHKGNASAFESYLPLGTKAGKASKGAEARDIAAIFKIFSLGVVTSRDDWAYAFHAKDVNDKIGRLIHNYNYEVFRLRPKERKSPNISDFINSDPSFIKWTDRLKTALASGLQLKLDKDKIRRSMYRPYIKKYLYFDHLLNQRRYQFPRILPIPERENENRVICLSGIGSSKPFHCLLSAIIPCLDLLEKTQCFPFYVYTEDGSKRRENITDWALQAFREHYEDKKINKWDIFHYVYGLLHHPGYRTKYADNLRRELPRVPFAPDFKAFSKAGAKLAKWHLEYEGIEPYELKFIESKDHPLSYLVEDKMRLSKDKKSLVVNQSLILGGIPPETYEYRLGNRGALEWVIDQYQVKTDRQSGIESDPNRSDDPEYIVRLVGQIVKVSLETVKIVNSLPKDFGG